MIAKIYDNNACRELAKAETYLFLRIHSRWWFASGTIYSSDQKFMESLAWRFGKMLQIDRLPNGRVYVMGLSREETRQCLRLCENADEAQEMIQSEFRRVCGGEAAHSAS